MDQPERVAAIELAFKREDTITTREQKMEWFAMMGLQLAEDALTVQFFHSIGRDGMITDVNNRRIKYHEKLRELAPELGIG